MQKTITVCNVCENPQRETTAYDLKQGGRKQSVDLCSEHGAPLERLLPKKPGRKPGVSPQKKVDGPAGTRRRTRASVGASTKAPETAPDPELVDA